MYRVQIQTVLHFFLIDPVHIAMKTFSDLQFCSADVCHYYPLRALKKLSQMPNFALNHQRFLFDRIQSEVNLGCRNFQEPFEKATFGLEDLERFEPSSYYSQQCASFPLLTTALAASVSNGKFEAGCVQVSGAMKTNNITGH